MVCPGPQAPGLWGLSQPPWSMGILGNEVHVIMLSPLRWGQQRKTQPSICQEHDGLGADWSGKKPLASVL